MLTKPKAVTQELQNPLDGAHTQTWSWGGCPLKRITDSTSYFTARRVTDARGTWQARESSCATEHKQTRQWNLADREWARGQEFLNPNPSPTIDFCAALDSWGGGVAGVKSVIHILVLCSKRVVSLLPKEDRKFGILCSQTAYLDGRITQCSSADYNHWTNQHSTAVFLASSSPFFQIDRCRPPLTKRRLSSPFYRGRNRTIRVFIFISKYSRLRGKAVRHFQPNYWFPDSVEIGILGQWFHFDLVVIVTAAEQIQSSM